MFNNNFDGPNDARDLMQRIYERRRKYLANVPPSHGGHRRQRDTTGPVGTFDPMEVEEVTEAFTLTITWDEPVVGFTVDSLTLTNCTASDFTQVDDLTYTVLVTPTWEGDLAWEIEAGACTDASGNPCSGVGPGAGYDKTAPTCVISTDATEPVSAAFTATFTFSEVVTGFDAAADITVTNGTTSDPVDSGGGKTYTATITPDFEGNVTVSVDAGACQDNAGNGNIASNTLEVEIQNLVLTATSQSATGINLTWVDTGAEELGYKIERSLDETAWTQIAVVGVGVQLYRDTHLDPNTPYYYRMRTYDGGGDGPYGTTASATTETPTYVDEISLDTFTGANGTRLNTLGWTEHNGIWEIRSNTARQATATGSVVNYMATRDAGVADFEVSVHFKTVNTSEKFVGGVLFRFVDTSNFWAARVLLDGSTPNYKVELYRAVAGTWTLIASKTYADRRGKTLNIKVRCVGDEIDVWVEGGFHLTTTDATHNTATHVGLLETRTSAAGSWRQLIFDDFQVVSPATYAPTFDGVVLEQTTGTDADQNLQEVSILYDTDPQILTGDRVYKAWWSHGYGYSEIEYAESADGVTWTKYGSNPVLSDYMHCSVMKVGDTFYFYGVNRTHDRFDRLSSADGITWSLDATNIIPKGSAGQWDDGSRGNIFVWVEDSTWRCLYEARSGSGPWESGYASSSDGTTWTKGANNPVIGNGEGTFGGSYVQKVGNTYYAWLHGGLSGTLPSYIMRFKTTDPSIAWTPEPYGVIIPRSGAEDGEDTVVGQVADPWLVEVDGEVWLYYEGTARGDSAAGHMKIKRVRLNANAIAGY